MILCQVGPLYYAMLGRKGKESSSASLDEIKELINTKFETLELKLNATENKFDVI